MARHDMNLPSLIMANGYSISYDHDRNQIVIGLPQTDRSLTSTVLPVRNRNEVTVGLLNALLALTTVRCETQEGNVRLTEFEKGQFDVLNWLASAWHGKQYYFAQDNGLIYSRESGKYMPLDDAIGEFCDHLEEDE